MINFMKGLFYKPLFFIILFLLTGLLIVFDGLTQQATQLIFEHISTIQNKLNNGVRATLSLPEELINALKLVASKSILIYLTFALVTFLFFSLRMKDYLAKRASISLTLLLITGMIGFIWQPHEAPVISYEVTKKRSDIPLTTGDELKTLIRFKTFQEDFKTYLDKALKGEVRVFIQPYFIGNFIHTFSIGDHVFPPTQGSSKLYISSKVLNVFLKTKEVTLHSKALGKETFNLRVRDLNKQSRTRQDTLALNSNTLDLKGDAMLLLFGFETNDGKPLIAFY
ncbi:MAG: hypothetical protein GW748_03725 [Alphaproteobacteria bacterium]|nr:hypothetical protein [Alphaproteobacteria bacterium]NCQ66833.1 hypothetical protein [Alphaproteobacteria bacterium]NCT07401.1 hypothetical protein [Alphaproteobacteria bacterium]